MAVQKPSTMLDSENVADLRIAMFGSNQTDLCPFIPIRLHHNSRSVRNVGQAPTFRLRSLIP
jgi:hypothetical protein